MYLKHHRNLKNVCMHSSFFHSFNMIQTSFSCSSTWNNSWYCFLSFCLFTWNTAGATIASSSLKVMVKGQKSKDKDRTPLLQGSIQFFLIRQSCHWNQWQLCLNKKSRIGISVLLVCNLTICPTWHERTTKGRTNSFSLLKNTLCNPFLWNWNKITQFFLWNMFFSLLLLWTYTDFPYGCPCIVTQPKSLVPIPIRLLPSTMPTLHRWVVPSKQQSYHNQKGKKKKNLSALIMWPK